MDSLTQAFDEIAHGLLYEANLEHNIVGIRADAHDAVTNVANKNMKNAGMDLAKVMVKVIGQEPWGYENGESKTESEGRGKTLLEKTIAQQNKWYFYILSPMLKIDWLISFYDALILDLIRN